MEIFKNPLTVSMENFIIRQTDRQTDRRTDRQGLLAKKKGGKSYLNSSLLLTSERRLNTRGDFNG